MGERKRKVNQKIFSLINYKMQANFNKFALSSNCELAEKYRFLIELTTACKPQNVHFAIACSTLIFLKGIWSEFNDFDLIVHPDDCEKMVDLLHNLGFKDAEIKNDQSIYRRNYFGKFYREKIEIDLVCEWGILGGGNSCYQYHFKEAQITHLKVSQELTIPLMPLEAQFILYRMLSWHQPERTIKANFIYLYFLSENGGIEHPDVFTEALTQPLPNMVKSEIENLTKN